MDGKDIFESRAGRHKSDNRCRVLDLLSWRSFKIVYLHVKMCKMSEKS